MGRSGTPFMGCLDTPFMPPFEGDEWGTSFLQPTTGQGSD